MSDSNITVNEHGKWLVDGDVCILIEQSENYKTQLLLEEQNRLEEELLESLKPSEKEILMAEIELNAINLLLEMEVF